MADDTPVNKGDLAGLEMRLLARMSSTEARIAEKIDRIETNLLTGFHGWSAGINKAP